MMSEEVSSFSLSELTKLHSTKAETIMSFNELSSFGLFYSVKKRIGQDIAKGSGDRYVINPKVCSEILINHKPELIIGKRFYQFTFGDESIFGGFIKDESNLCDDIKSLVQQVYNKDINTVNPGNVIAVEVTGMASLVEYKEKWVEVLNVPETQYEYDYAFDESLIESLMESYKPSFDGLPLEGEKVKKVSGGVSNITQLEMGPQYSIFGPIGNKYEWVTSSDQLNHFPEV
ncbi:MAG: hypothetical protein J6N72_11505 [Psychrobacter sp.]|nr:hypothetical protein [Psychrobacter sp.]